MCGSGGLVAEVLYGRLFKTKVGGDFFGQDFSWTFYEINLLFNIQFRDFDFYDRGPSFL